MKQQPDKIFRDKLSDHSKPVPPIAWDRLEKGLDGKTHSIKWYSIAAAVAFLTVATVAYYSFQNEPVKVAVNPVVDKIISPKKPIERSASTEQVDKLVEQSTQPVATEESMESPGSNKKVEELQTPESKAVDVALIENPDIENELASNDAEEIVMDSTIHSLQAPAQLAFKAPAKKEENVTIVFTADQTKEYLITKNTSPEATSQEKKASTFKKLLKKAADLKVNQDPFGELRQKKNEILALNFRSEKRGQK